MTRRGYSPCVRRAMIVVGLSAIAIAAGGCGSATSAGPSHRHARAADALDKVVLRASQIGHGYHLKMRPDGHGVAGYVTLDLCGSSFPSEALRTERLQVNYIGGAAQLSNEVVRYRGGGARQALSEVRSAALNCPNHPVKSPVAGVPPLTYRIKSLHDAHLPPGSFAARLRATGRRHGRTVSVTRTLVYQARGDLMSAIYGAGSSARTQMRVTLHAAHAATSNLKRAHS
jgi:hypothetical protein